MIKVLSTFDGISALQVALNNIGIKDYMYFASEIDKYAISVTQKNFPNTIQLGDVRDLFTTETIEDLKRLKKEDPEVFEISDYLNAMQKLHNDKNIDLICGGSPCQDLSIAKKDRKGLNGERSGLFYEYVRILNEAKPKFFILENVASMSKEARYTITKELFGIEPVLLNSALVTAQQRKRLFWVGVLQQDGTYKKVDIQQPQDKRILLKDILESETDLKDYKSESISFINKNQNKNGLQYVGRINGRDWAKNGKSLSRNAPQGDRIYSIQGKSVCLSANGGGRGAKTGLYKIDLPDGDYTIRKLTPNECARLQGFPDNYHNGISNTQAYKCYGNSFTVPIIEHILKTIFNI